MSKKKVDHTGQRLVYDIEVSPATYWLWKAGYGINVPTGNLIKEAAVICISYQWEGGAEVHHLKWDRKQCDKAMLKKFVPIMQEAGVLIGHNSDGFDEKWIRTRCLFHRIPCPPDFVRIDTWKLAKKYLRLQGNGLKYFSKFLGLEGKIEPRAGLWQDVVFNKSKEAMAEMLKYCDRDVSQTMEVYEALIPYVGAIGHVGKSMQDCAHCGDSNTKWEKVRISTAGASRTQFRCTKPGCLKYGTCPTSKWNKNTKIK